MNGSLTLWIEDAKFGDYIVAIDGKAIESFGRQWRSALQGKKRLQIARRVAGKMQIFEVDCYDVGPNG